MKRFKAANGSMFLFGWDGSSGLGICNVISWNDPDTLVWVPSAENSAGSVRVDYDLDEASYIEEQAGGTIVCKLMDDLEIHLIPTAAPVHYEIRIIEP